MLTFFGVPGQAGTASARRARGGGPRHEPSRRLCRANARPRLRKFTRSLCYVSFATVLGLSLAAAFVVDFPGLGGFRVWVLFCLGTRILIHIHMHMHMHMHMYMHIHINLHINLYILILIHIHTHTHVLVAHIVRTHARPPRS